MPRAKEIVEALAAECVPREVEEKLVEELLQDPEDAYEYLLKYISMKGIVCYSQIVYAINRLDIREDAISLLLGQAICPTRILPPKDIGRRLHYLHAPPSVVDKIVNTLLNIGGLDEVLAAAELVAGYAAPWNSGYIYRNIYQKLVGKAGELLLKHPPGPEHLELLHALISLAGIMERGYSQLASLVRDAVAKHMTSKSDEARLHCSRCLRRLARLLATAHPNERRVMVEAVVKTSDTLVQAYRDEPLYEVKANILDAVCFMLRCLEAPIEAKPLYRVLEEGLRDIYSENRERARECLESLSICRGQEGPERRGGGKTGLRALRAL